MTNVSLCYRPDALLGWADGVAERAREFVQPISVGDFQKLALFSMERNEFGAKLARLGMGIRGDSCSLMPAIEFATPYVDYFVVDLGGGLAANRTAALDKLRQLCHRGDPDGLRASKAAIASAGNAEPRKRPQPNIIAEVQSSSLPSGEVDGVEDLPCDEDFEGEEQEPPAAFLAKIPLFLTVEKEDLAFWVEFFLKDKTFSKENIGFVCGDVEVIRRLYAVLHDPENAQSVGRCTGDHHESDHSADPPQDAGISRTGRLSNWFSGDSTTTSLSRFNQHDTADNSTTATDSDPSTTAQQHPPPYRLSYCPIVYRMQDDMLFSKQALAVQAINAMTAGANVVQVFALFIERGFPGLRDFKAEIGQLLLAESHEEIICSYPFSSTLCRIYGII